MQEVEYKGEIVKVDDRYRQSGYRGMIGAMM